MRGCRSMYARFGASPCSGACFAAHLWRRGLLQSQPGALHFPVVSSFTSLRATITCRTICSTTTSVYTGIFSRSEYMISREFARCQWASHHLVEQYIYHCVHYTSCLMDSHRRISAYVHTLQDTSLICVLHEVPNCDLGSHNSMVTSMSQV